MDLDFRNGLVTEPSVDESAFWHTNMDLYYGYLPGEVVEVEHEPMKYWLARIEFSYKHLVLLKWLGNYGYEFWIDTSLASSATTGLCSSSSNSNTTCTNNLVDDEDNSFLRDYPRRLFPLGYHLQSQIKSQFVLEKPTKILVKPSLYNPAKDPYADIKTVDDLLAHEVDSGVNDAFASQSTSNSINEVVSLSLVRNKTKINYGQEDQDELEAALQNLNDEIDGDHQYTAETNDCTQSISMQCDKSEDINRVKSTKIEDSSQNNNDNKDSGIGSDASNNLISTNTNNIQSDGQTDASIESDATSSGNQVVDMKSDLQVKSQAPIEQIDIEQQERDSDKAHVEMCRKLQESAISKGRYMGINLSNNDYCEDEIYFSKPKQFFDIGGANQERVFVPGTLVEVAHHVELAGELNLYHWFAYVVKNIGGRLTLRWLFCTSNGKFKQGRLELKSGLNSLIYEEEVGERGGSVGGGIDGIPSNYEEYFRGGQLSSLALTFSLHFCDPRVHTIPYAKQNGRSYRFPKVLEDYLRWVPQIENASKDEDISSLQDRLIEFVLHTRRTNLDKDRPLIDHILTTARNRAPNYLDLIFAPKDLQTKREVLISCPKKTKLLKGYIKRELEPNVFEVHSDASGDDMEIIKFIYPLDSSFTILPMDWARDNEDCLLIDPSRNVSPTMSVGDKDDLDKESAKREGIPEEDKGNSNLEEETEELATHKPEETTSRNEQKFPNSCLAGTRAKFPRYGASFHKIPDLDLLNLPELKSKISIQDDYDPKCWSRILRSHELDAPNFHCCIDADSGIQIARTFKVMDQLEVVHPTSSWTICIGRIRKVVFPLLWIQISSGSYTVLPFNSTNIYPRGWCESYQHPIVSFLPPRKRHVDCQNTQSSNSNDSKKRKKQKFNHQDELALTADGKPDYKQIYVEESFDLNAVKDRQTEIDHLLNEKSMYIKIYFNHKCFTGPSLSKSKICTLPQYVGPGPMRLVIEEVVAKVISVAYVPPRILNDLSSQAFEDLLIHRNLKNTTPIEFKAKYQKRVHRELIPVCLNPNDVALYCECLCEHLKCCYNLFGPDQYDGDDCPGHCRALTKSNKFMKRATYYRDKARAGEFLANNNSNNNNAGDSSSKKNASGASAKATGTSRPRYAGRGSAESTSSSISRSDQVTSRASSTSGDEQRAGDCCLKTVEEEDEQVRLSDVNDENTCKSEEKVRQATSRSLSNNQDTQNEQRVLSKSHEQQSPVEMDDEKSTTRPECEDLMDELTECGVNSCESIANDPNDWSVDDVCRALEALGLGVFVRKMRFECIDGRALLLLDEPTIEEHFLKQTQNLEITSDELDKLCRFVDFAKVRLAG